MFVLLFIYCKNQILNVFFGIPAQSASFNKKKHKVKVQELVFFKLKMVVY